MEKPGKSPQDAFSARRSERKAPLDIDLLFARVEQAVRPFAKAALFELAEQGFSSGFEQLVACIISIRTRDETTLQLARRLFEMARTPAQVLALGAEGIEQLISESTFCESKARQILGIARRVEEEFAGELPCQRETLLSFAGVGPKCANLVLGIACGQAQIGVDIHVHRVTNRWGYVHAASPEATMRELERVLPRRYWVEINRLLVPFGKHICTGVLPRCSTCPVLAMCRQVGVTRHR
jgi:endonuclease-3